MTSGEHQLSTGTAVLGESFGYEFDAIGNRTSATVNGRTGGYTPNILNEYSEREVPAAFDVTGEADPGTIVRVNGAVASRQTARFYKEVSVNNSSTPVWSSVAVQAPKRGGGAGRRL